MVLTHCEASAALSTGTAPPGQFHLPHSRRPCLIPPHRRSMNNKAFSRVLIDKELEFSNWNLLDSRQVRFELNGSTGHADYVLSGQRGPLRVLEAKKQDLVPYDAKDQARGYLTHYVLFPSVNAFRNGMGKGQALKHLQITELAKMPIPLPPIHLQEEFSARVSQVKGLSSSQASHTRLDDLFESLLYRAFNGEL